MDRIDNNRIQEPHQDVQNKDKDEDYPLIWLEDGTLFVFHWAQEFSSKNPLVGKSFSIFIDSWRMKRPLIEGKKFHNFHWTRITSLRRGHGKLVRRFFYILCFSWKRGEWVCVRIINCYVWRNVVHGRNCVKQKSMERSCV
jgi:hypothetical protein